MYKLCSGGNSPDKGMVKEQPEFDVHVDIAKANVQMTQSGYKCRFWLNLSMCWELHYIFYRKVSICTYVWQLDSQVNPISSAN